MNIGTVIEIREGCILWCIELRYGVIVQIEDENFYQDDTFWETLYTVRCFTNLYDALKPQSCKLQHVKEYNFEESDIFDEYRILNTGKVNDYVVLSSI